MPTLRDSRRPHDLYRFYDADDRLLYIGISLNAAQRASQHKAEKPWWNEVARMDVEHLGAVTRQDAEATEREAIRTEMPTHNIVHSIKQDQPTHQWGMPFHFPYRMRSLKRVQAAVNDLGREFDWLDSKGQPSVSRSDFIALVERVARSVVYGDNCDACGETAFPISLEHTSSEMCRCFYECCGDVWSCSWSLEQG